jgi:CheY-like chemotaxis protein
LNGRRVNGDDARLDRIFGNLLENAMRYSPKGTTVTVGVEDRPGFVLAFVDDEGPGLPKAQPESQLFALFSKGKSHAGKAGLGLYFCKITVERWGGTIGAETRPRGGARFWFQLPRADKVLQNSEDPQSKKPSSVEQQPKRDKPAKRLRILVADDADINRELLIELLEKRGHVAMGAADGREAVAELEKHDFDVLLIDQEMPNMTGLQATQAIREREAGSAHHQMIIGISGHATEEDERRFRDAGMDALLAKPVHMQELYEVVESTVARGHGQPAAHIASPAATHETRRSGLTSLPPTMAIPEAAGDAIAHLKRSTGGSEKLMGSLVAILFADAPRVLARIGQAIAQNNSAEIAAAAHLLKGSLAIFGASKAVESARALEAMGRAANLREAPLEFRALETEFANLRTALAPLAPKQTPARPSKAKRNVKRPTKHRKS